MPNSQEIITCLVSDVDRGDCFEIGGQLYQVLDIQFQGPESRTFYLQLIATRNRIYNRAVFDKSYVTLPNQLTLIME